MAKKPEVFKAPNGKLVRLSFGMTVDPAIDDFDVARWAFINHDAAMEGGCDTTRPELFWWIVDYLWGEKSSAKKKFVRHPWAEKMTERACEHAYLGISGAASCGKSDWGAMWGLVNWICAPDSTKILITSTTMKDAQKRIWGSVRDYYYGASQKLMGKYVHSFGQIRTNAMASDPTASDKSGIELIPCGQSKETQAIGRLIGMKAPRMIVIADELPELTPALLEASESNLSANPVFQFIGLGNHVSWLDPFGVFVTPKAGINSVTVDDEEWETNRGVCIHFDGTKSPNFDFDKDVYPIYGRKQKREHDKLPTTSIGFWRFCRSFPPQDSEAGQLYSEIEIIANGCVSQPHWKGPVTKLAALDPAFVTGGDRCIGIAGMLGDTVDGQRCLSVTLFKQFHEDVTDKDVARNFQIARQFVAWCKSIGVDPENAAVDATGGGVPFADILSQEWSPRIHRVSFGGAASDLPVDDIEGKPGKELYTNRVSEIWGRGVAYVRSGQFKGLPRELVKEMIARRYDDVKGATVRMRVKSKEEMKKLLKMSPDLADSFFIMLDLAISRHAFFPDAFGKALKEEVAKSEAQRFTEGSLLDDFDCLANDQAEGHLADPTGNVEVSPSADWSSVFGRIFRG